MQVTYPSAPQVSILREWWVAIWHQSRARDHHTQLTVEYSYMLRSN
jgi:hypothetical protein